LLSARSPSIGSIVARSVSSFAISSPNSGKADAPPTREQLLAQLDEELNEAIDLAVKLNERTTVRGLRMVRLELCQIRRRENLKNKG
jgi:hypothetical protein